MQLLYQYKRIWRGGNSSYVYTYAQDVGSAKHLKSGESGRGTRDREAWASGSTTVEGSVYLRGGHLGVPPLGDCQTGGYLREP